MREILGDHIETRGRHPAGKLSGGFHTFQIAQRGARFTALLRQNQTRAVGIGITRTLRDETLSRRGERHATRVIGLHFGIARAGDIRELGRRLLHRRFDARTKESLGLTRGIFVDIALQQGHRVAITEAIEVDARCTQVLLKERPILLDCGKPLLIIEVEFAHHQIGVGAQTFAGKFCLIR